MSDLFDVLIIGAGPAGLAAAIAAKARGLSYVVLEKGALVNSLLHYPSDMVFFTTPELMEIGELPFVSPHEKPNRLEALRYYRRVTDRFSLDVRLGEPVTGLAHAPHGGFEVVSQAGGRETRSRQAPFVVVASGAYDFPNRLGVRGEDLPHVSHYYTEPYSFFDRDVVIVGGRNSAAEAALDLFRGGARVSLVHRGAEMGSTLKYWVRPDIENRFKAGEVKAYFNALINKITPSTVEIVQAGTPITLRAEQVFLLTGYHSSTRFFEQLGVKWDGDTLRPQYNTETYETNVPGVYLAGSIVGGRFNAEVFIENGRFHGETVVKAIASK